MFAQYLAKTKSTKTYLTPIEDAKENKLPLYNTQDTSKQAGSESQLLLPYHRQIKLKARTPLLLNTHKHA